MPYILQKSGNNWVVVKKATGKVVAGNKTKLTRARALAAMRARYHAESGRPFTKQG